MATDQDHAILRDLRPVCSVLRSRLLRRIISTWWWRFGFPVTPATLSQHPYTDGRPQTIN